MAPDQRRERYIAGLDAPEQPQSPSGTESDAQRIVLRQFLQSAKAQPKLDAIVDIGSGKGVLAAELCIVWEGTEAPRYVAVDLSPQLTELVIPLQLHNNSCKFDFHEFLRLHIKSFADLHTVFVIRNVIHELDIEQTSDLFFRLREILNPKCILYVQDMINLPVVERRNVGWRSNDIQEFLEFCGFKFDRFEVSGRSGTNWFSGIAKISGTPKSKESILKKCFDIRSRQKEDALKTFADAEQSSEEDSKLSYMRASFEISTLERQLDAVRPLVEASVHSA